MAKSADNEYKQQRLSKVDRLREREIDPYPYEFDRTHTVSEALDIYDPEADEKIQDEVSVCGRIVARREHGGAAFVDIEDESGTIQIYISKDYLDDESVWDRYNDLWDVGDFVGIDGELFETGEGEISVVAREAKMLSKGLRPLPEKFHGLKDKELRYRKRYLDLLSNDNTQDTFKTRSQFLLNLRNQLNQRDFMEVETPMMQTLYGGAEAEPFKTHHNALDLDLYLRIAPELFLKRLLVGGFEQVYEINRNFRNEGISTQHNPEFTMLELYQSYVDYHQIMELTEQVIGSTVDQTLGTTTVEWNGKTIDWSPPWDRKPLLDIIEEHTGVEWSLDQSQQDVFDQAYDEGIEVEPCETASAQLMEVFDEAVEPNIVDPTFVTEFPADISPLAKTHRDKPNHAERFELFCGGLEIGNAYSELNDPQQQRENFERQAEDKSEIDEDYLEALEYGMPPAGGLGIGIDRVVMLITDSPSIRDVILFPLLKPQSE